MAIDARAAILREAPGKWEVHDVVVDAPREREVLVRMVATGLCHSDDHFAVLPEWACVKVDPDVPLEVAAILGCAVPTGWGSAQHAGEVGPGEVGATLDATEAGADEGARVVITF